MTTHRLEALRREVAGERAYPLECLAQPGLCKEGQERGHSTETMLSVTIKQGANDQRTLLSTSNKKISFNRYFYKPELMRKMEKNQADLLEVERKIEGFLAEIVGGAING